MIRPQRLTSSVLRPKNRLRTLKGLSLILRRLSSLALLTKLSETNLKPSRLPSRRRLIMRKKSLRSSSQGKVSMEKRLLLPSPKSLSLASLLLKQATPKYFSI
jgi:hypothetical protein